MTTPDPITTARQALDKAYAVCRNLAGTDESDFHDIATVFDLVEKLKAERDGARKAVLDAYDKAADFWEGWLEDARQASVEGYDKEDRACMAKANTYSEIIDAMQPALAAALTARRAASQWIKDRAEGER